MSTATVIDITMKDLHAYFQNYRATQQGLTDPAQTIVMAVQARWPGANPDDVLRQAEINWLREQHKDIVRDASRKLAQWITTTARSRQGDLFDTMPEHIELKVPPSFLFEGSNEPVPYWKVSIVDALPYLEVREQALAAEEGAMMQLAIEKRNMKDQVRVEKEKLIKMIRMSEADGIDPRTVKYVKREA